MTQVFLSQSYLLLQLGDIEQNGSSVFEHCLLWFINQNGYQKILMMGASQYKHGTCVKMLDIINNE